MCLFDVEWATRLWCVWELAVYLRLADNPQVKFVSISQNNIQTGVVAVIIVMYVSSQVALNLSGAQDGSPTAKEVVDWGELICHLIISALVFIFGQKHYRAIDQLREMIRNYDCRDAKLAVPEDRVVLLGFVNDLFKNDDQNSQFARDSHQSRGSGQRDSQTSSHISPTSHASNKKRNSIDSASFDSLGDVDEEAGIRRFNRAVQLRVPDQLPLSGLQSWKVMSYMGAVIAFSSRYIFANLDVLAYEGFSLTWAITTAGVAGGGGQSSEQYWRSILCLLWTCLVQFPFSVYTLGVEVKILLLAQEYVMKVFDCSYNFTLWIFVPLFMIWDSIFNYRGLFDLNVSQTIYVAMGTQPGAKPRLQFAYFYGFDKLFHSEQ